jgi:hypothetical protein
MFAQHCQTGVEFTLCCEKPCVSWFRSSGKGLGVCGGGLARGPWRGQPGTDVLMSGPMRNMLLSDETEEIDETDVSDVPAGSNLDVTTPTEGATLRGFAEEM